MNAQEKTKEEALSNVQAKADTKDLQVFDTERTPGFKPLAKMAQKEIVLIPGTGIKPSEVIKGDHVANGVGLRNRGGGTINLRGIPANVTLNKAYLYWCILGNAPLQNATVSINGAAVNGTLVGTGADPCWLPPGSHNYVYRAAVPNYLLYVGGNGDYEISGVPSSQGYGSSPWEMISGPYHAEGATLVIFFTRNSGYNPQTYLYDAAVSGTMFTSGFSTDLLGFTATKPTAKFTMIGADGQTGSGVSSWYYCTKEESYFGGIRIAGTPQDLNSPYQDADSDWNGHDGEPLNQLWDTRTHIVPMKLNSTSANVKYQSNGDCLVICAFILTI
jgi:hypothetical protein